MYKCERCGYLTEYKGNLKNHFKRKKPCNPILSNTSIETLKEKFNKKLIKNKKLINSIKIEPELNPIEPKLNPINKINKSEKKYICKFCKKSYSTNSNLHKHMKKCTNVDLSDNEKVVNYINDIKKENKEIKKEKKKMRKEIEKLIDKLAEANTTNNNIQQNIIINNYGKENLDYLTPEYLTNLLKIPFQSIQSLIKNIHFNPKHPENHNIKITNKKQNLATVYNSGIWEFKDKKDVIENIVDNSYNMLDCHYDTNLDDLNKNKQTRFIEFQDKYSSDNKTKKKIEKDTEIIVLNGNSDT